MQAISLVLSFSLLVLTHGQCGAKIQSRMIKADGSLGNFCYLNSGHKFDATQHDGEDRWRHGLDALDEYNVFWQCGIPITASRTWYFAAGVGSQMFTFLKDRNDAVKKYILRGDISYGQGIFIDKNEVNAKVDQTVAPGYFKMGYYSSGSNAGAFIAYKRAADGRWMRLQRDDVKGDYTTIAGKKVPGYEAKFQVAGFDKDRNDNYVRLFGVPCPGSGDVSPVPMTPLAWPESKINPVVNPVNAAPTDVLIKLPAQLSYVVGLLFVLVLVNLAYFVYSCRRKSENVRYKSVKYDSDTDAV